MPERAVHNAEPQQQASPATVSADRQAWPLYLLWAGAAAVAIPTLFALGRKSWTAGQGEQGPIVLAIGLWLVWRIWPAMVAAARPAAPAAAAAAMGLAGLLYLTGRVADHLPLECMAMYLLGVASLYALVGVSGLRKGWFPVAYLLFALPMPYIGPFSIASRLRLWISQTTIDIAHAFDLDVGRSGVDLFVDSHQITIAQACSGMNSLFTLSAIGLCYIYVRRSPHWPYFLLMLPVIIGFAIVGNLVRVLALVAMTHFGGEAIAQGPLHETTGFITFATALSGVMAVDAVAAFVLRRLKVRP